MEARRAEIWLEGLGQGQIDALAAAGVAIAALMKPTLVTVTRGTRAHDGRFDYDPRKKPEWLAFEEEHDFVFWRPGGTPGGGAELVDGSELGTAEGRAFALGEANIRHACVLDGWLPVWPSPLAWLKAGRRGIVILDWSRVFDELRDVPRILGETVKVAERIDRLMHPARLPAIAARKKPARRAHGDSRG